MYIPQLMDFAEANTTLLRLYGKYPHIILCLIKLPQLTDTHKKVKDKPKAHGYWLVSPAMGV